MEENLTYTLVLHQIRKKLGLTIMEYCFADCIYHLSNNPNSKIQGWCYASKETLSDFLGISPKHAFALIKRLIQKGLVERDEETKYLKTTSKWYESVVLVKAKAEYKSRSQTITKGNTKVLPNFIPDYNQTSYNNNIHNETNKDSLVGSENFDLPIKSNEIESIQRKQMGKGDINYLMNYLKEKMDLVDMDYTDKENRNFCELCLKKFHYGRTKKIIDIASQDQNFWALRVTSFKDVYYNGVKIEKSLKDKFRKKNTTLNVKDYI